MSSRRSSSDVDRRTDVATVARGAGGPAPPTDGEICEVVVVSGPDTGLTFPVERHAPSRLLIGTSPACNLRLTDPTVSRRHAALDPAGARYRITDLGSTNGTYVDGVPIVEAFVRGGESVRIGDTTLRFDAKTAVSRKPLPSAMRFGSVIGASAAMRRLYPLCERLAKTDLPIIIEGETGTGKENLAEALHQMGGSKGPFVVFDCTTLAPTLAESELFGHERGAFTGAVGSRPGVFEQANGGTLLIDEIGDLDLALQAKLLRAIDRREVRRVGGQSVIRVDVRLIAATRRDLDKEVAEGRFRDDLFHRLAVARIELPPLRDRTGDVTILARHFVKSLGGDLASLTATALQRLEAYSWPGNVRELRNAVLRTIALGEESVPLSSTPASGPGAPRGDWLESLLSAKLPFVVARRRALDEFSKRYVESVLAEHGGNATRAAEASGIALRYFHQVRARSRRSGDSG